MLIAFAQGEEMRKRIGAVKYMETSSRTGEGVYDAFRTIVTQSVAHQVNKKTGSKSRGR